MKRYPVVLGLLTIFFGCQGADEITGPDRPEAVAPRPDSAVAAPNPRKQPVVVTRPAVAREVAARPEVTPGVHCRQYPPKLGVPCEEVTAGSVMKNKPSYDD